MMFFLNDQLHNTGKKEVEATSIEMQSYFKILLKDLPFRKTLLKSNPWFAKKSILELWKKNRKSDLWIILQVISV